MRVLFVTHDNVSHEPLGLMYVSGALIKAGHVTAACEEKNVLGEVESFRPDFVGFQVLTGDQTRWGQVALRVKKHFPQVQTIFGGPHFLFFNKIGQEGADFIVRGEAEKSIVNLVEGKPWENLVVDPDLDSIPFADRSLFYNDQFPAVRDNVIRNFMTTRGCIYKCTYCYNSNENWQKMVGEGRKRIRMHSPEYVVNEIEEVFMRYKGQLVSFQDDIFSIDMEWLERWVKLYQRLRIPFFAQLRPKFITEDRVKLLKQANVHIVSFAIESGVEKTRTEILDRKETNDEIYRATQLLHKYGIKFRMQNLLALPVEDPLKDALETLKFNMKCRPTLSWCSLLQAYPGTKIADYVVKIGMVKSLEELMPLVNSTFFDECSLPIKEKKRIERLHKYWSATVRWPWLYPIVRVLIYFNFGRRLHNWIFNLSKGYINKKEYWRVEKSGLVQRRVTQSLDRLGGELVRK